MFRPPGLVTVTVSLFTPSNSKLEKDPLFSVRPPTVKLPTPVPGAKIAPLARFTTPPTVPLPLKLAPLRTLVVPVDRLPLTSKVPAPTVVPPVCALAPESTRVPAPVFVRLPVVAAEPPLIVNVVAAFVTSTVPLEPLLIVKLRFVVGVVLFVRLIVPFVEFSDVFVYRSVPPLKTKLEAALVEMPRVLAVPKALTNVPD